MVSFKLEDSVPVMTVQGRLDARGAEAFDHVWGTIPNTISHVVVDLSGIEYISSVGIRSLVTAEKALRARRGNVAIAGVSSFVRSVLDTAGLLNEFVLIDELAEAKQFVLNSEKEERSSFEQTVEGRTYRIRPNSGEACYLDVWGSFDSVPDEPRSAFATLMQHTDTAPVDVNVADIGLAFGEGALGNARQWIAEYSGPFFSNGSFAAVLSRGHNIPDYAISEHPQQLELAVSKAVSFSGPPTAKISLTTPNAAPLKAVLHEILMLLSEHKGATIETLGFQFEESTKPGSLLIGLYSPRGFWGTRLRFRSVPVAKPKLDDLDGVAELTLDSTIHSGSLSVFVPKSMRHGTERLLKIEVEGGVAMKEAMKDDWYQIIRRLYRDCSRVVLTQLTGGYMATTFRVVSYDKEGRRMLPTVAKISTVELIQREEAAHRAYVQKFILNNSTTIMGTASAGDWSALRYNFLGISGPNSTLTWFADHYQKRPAEDLEKLYDRLYTQILKPWYGQPRWEALKLYEDHTPLRLFPNLCVHAERDFGFSTKTETIRCDELGMDLPNPFRYLEQEYSKRKNQTQLWYQGVTHGDLNPRNILVDERDNMYVIDFSETRLRNIVSDFARMEAILKIETTRVDTSEDVARLVEFELGLAEMRSLDQVPPNHYKGDDPKVAKAYAMICRLRKYADIATLFETDVTPYWLAVLEWTYSVLSYDLGPLRRKLGAYSAAILCGELIKASDRSEPR